MRYCKDIAMFAIDRPETSCKFATTYCKRHCYNYKLYRLYGSNMRTCDMKNETLWQGDIASHIKEVLRHAKRNVNRIRLMTRGEALATQEDFNKVASIAKSIPNTLIWVPTRAWRHYSIDMLNTINNISNIRLLLSTDVTTFEDTMQGCKERAKLHVFLENGYSTMFFGDNTRNAFVIAGREYTFKKCAKTWNKSHGHCIKCRGGCFSPKQVHIHLKKH